MILKISWIKQLKFVNEHLFYKTHNIDFLKIYMRFLNEIMKCTSTCIYMYNVHESN